jgi:hypothetical protein
MTITATKTERLAGALLADRNRAKTDHNIVACLSCGRTYIYKGRQGELNGRFCSMRCQDWYDADNPTYEQHQVETRYTWLDGRLMRKGSKGFYIDCAHCHKEFDSKGLRCCSPDCERRYRDRKDNLAVMAEVGMAIKAKRRCANPACANTIPTWRNGRRVSAMTRFCSPRCSRQVKAAA